MPGRRRSPIGSHLSVAGGLARCLPRADLVGAEAVQLFLASPRAWATPTVDPTADELFAASCASATLPVFVHAPYLINFGSPSEETVRRSAAALAFCLDRATRIGARGVVMHAGSAVLGNPWAESMRQVAEHLPRVLDGAPDAPPLLIEPTAGGGGALAADAASTAAYLDQLHGDERIGLCLDTCHLHASGHDLSSGSAFRTELRAFIAAAGAHRIGLVHVNDSRDPAGSRRDRHAALGRGTIGLDPFAALFGSTALRGVPMIVESTDEDHAADIAALKQLRDS